MKKFLVLIMCAFILIGCDESVQLTVNRQSLNTEIETELKRTFPNGRMIVDTRPQIYNGRGGSTAHYRCRVQLINYLHMSSNNSCLAETANIIRRNLTGINEGFKKASQRADFQFSYDLISYSETEFVFRITYSP